MRQQIFISVLSMMILSVPACQKKNNSDQNTVKQDTTYTEGTFGHDLAFLKKYKPVILLTAPDNENAQAIVVADYQGRVMTSTAGGNGGNSYGWVNYSLISSGESKKHINAFGGEDRFWLSPEGGQFSVYFEKGAKFDFENWQTPAVIDSEAFAIVTSDAQSVQFRKHAVLENHSGTKFEFTVDRKVAMLGKEEISKLLSVSALLNLKTIAYTSENTITNDGADWSRETGAVGVWILGMFKPSESTTIIAPFTTLHAPEPLLTDNYFGSIPHDRLIVKDSAVFLKADGKFRSKIGLAPLSAKPVAGSYDAEKGILTIIQYDLDPQGDYLKSTWEQHKEPYKGDALNAYNDGPLEDGTQMGPFYELESNSSVKLLKKGEKLVHHHRTFHFEGSKEELNQVAKQVLGVELENVAGIFK